MNEERVRELIRELLIEIGEDFVQFLETIIQAKHTGHNLFC